MRNILFVAFAIGLVSGICYGERTKTVSMEPQRGDLALGAILGSPTGLSMKYWLGNSNAVDACFGVPFDSDVNFSFHGDFHWLFPAAEYAPGSLGFFVGVGGRIRSFSSKSKDSADFGVRVPIGFEFQSRSNSLNFFAEIVPVPVLAPNRVFSMDGGVGIRFKFPAARNRP